MATIDRNTGRPLEGIDDVWQSITVILCTTLASLVMARDFGSTMPRLVDRAINHLTLIEFYAAVPQAIARTNPETLMAEEPRFRLSTIKLADMTSNGNAVFEIDGLYYPRGHLGDFSEVRDARNRVVINASDIVTGSVLP